MWEGAMVQCKLDLLLCVYCIRRVTSSHRMQTVNRAPYMGRKHYLDKHENKFRLHNQHIKQQTSSGENLAKPENTDSGQQLGGFMTLGVCGVFDAL